MRVHILLFAVAASVGSLAHAADDSDKNKVIEKPVVADTLATFAQQASWIEQEMQPDGRYEFAKPADKQRVTVLMAQISSLLVRAGSVAAMDHDTKVQLFNDQEEVNGLLRHNDVNRLVCESRQPAGSHIPVTTCHTYRHVEETARNKKIGLQQFDHSQLCDGANSENSCSPGKTAGSSAGGR